MITDALILMFVNFLSTIYNLLPDWDMSNIYGPSGSWQLYDGINHGGNGTALQAIVWWMHYYNDFAPFDHFLLILNLGAITLVVVVTYKLVKWLIGVIRGAGTS